MKNDGKTDLLDEKNLTNYINNADDTQSDDLDATHPPQISDEDNANQEFSANDSAFSTSLIPQEEDDSNGLQIGSVRFRGNLLLKHEDTSTIFKIENTNLTEAVIGRFDKRTGFKPTIDLSSLEERNLSVSRRHATINLRGQLIFVTDHNSLNGTFLNGQRLAPEQSRVIRDSDVLRIGNLTLIVSFEDTKSE